MHSFPDLLRSCKRCVGIHMIEPFCHFRKLRRIIAAAMRRDKIIFRKGSGQFNKVFQRAEFNGYRILSFLFMQIIVALSHMGDDGQPRLAENFHRFHDERIRQSPVLDHRMKLEAFCALFNIGAQLIQYIFRGTREIHACKRNNAGIQI